MLRVDVGKAILGFKEKIILSTLLGLISGQAFGEFGIPHISGPTGASIGAAVSGALRPPSVVAEDHIKKLEAQRQVIDMAAKTVFKDRGLVIEQLLKTLGNDPQNIVQGGLPADLMALVDKLRLAVAEKDVTDAATALKKHLWPNGEGKITKEKLLAWTKELEDAQTEEARLAAAEKLVKSFNWDGLQWWRKNGVVDRKLFAEALGLSKTDPRIWDLKLAALDKKITWFENLGRTPNPSPSPSAGPSASPSPTPSPTPFNENFIPDPNDFNDPFNPDFNPNAIDQNDNDQNDINDLIDEALNERLGNKDKDRGRGEGASGGAGGAPPGGGGSAGGGGGQPPQISGSVQMPPKGDKDKPEKFVPPSPPPPPDLTGLFALAMANSKNDDNGDFLKFVMATNQRLGETNAQDKFFEMMMARSMNSQNTLQPILEALAKVSQPPPPPPQLTVTRRGSTFSGAGGGGGAFANGMTRARLRRMPRLFPDANGSLSPVVSTTGTGTTTTGRRPRVSTVPTVSTASTSASSASSAVRRAPLGRGSSNKRPIR